MRCNRTLQFILLSATLAGCAATHPKVENLGEDAYRLSTSGTAVNTQADVNFKAVSAAIAYCGSMNKQMLFRHSQETGEHTWSAKREDLTFVCMNGSDPAFMSAGLRKEDSAPQPIVVIAQQ
jgi:hypothetical protein